MLTLAGMGQDGHYWDLWKPMVLEQNCRSDLQVWEALGELPALSEPWLSPPDHGGDSGYLIYILRFANEMN